MFTHHKIVCEKLPLTTECAYYKLRLLNVFKSFVFPIPDASTYAHYLFNAFDTTNNGSIKFEVQTQMLDYLLSTIVLFWVFGLTIHTFTFTNFVMDLFHSAPRLSCLCLTCVSTICVPYISSMLGFCDGSVHSPERISPRQAWVDLSSVWHQQRWTNQQRGLSESVLYCCIFPSTTVTKTMK